MADPHALGRLYAAVRYGDVAELDALLRAGVDVNARFGFGIDGGTALHEACRVGQPACMRLLLAAGADHNIRGRQGVTLLYLAANFGTARHTECVAALLHAGADICAATHNTGLTPLITAASFARPETVRLLCEAAHAQVGTRAQFLSVHWLLLVPCTD